MQASVAQITLPSSLCTLLRETEPCSVFAIRVSGLSRPLTTLCSGCCPSVRLLDPPPFSGLHLGSDYHLTLHPPSPTPGLRPLPASDYSSARAIAHLFSVRPLVLAFGSCFRFRLPIMLSDLLLRSDSVPCFLISVFLSISVLFLFFSAVLFNPA